MSKARISMQQLADESGRKPDDVVATLLEHGLPVRSRRSSLLRPYWVQARKALGIRPPVKAESIQSPPPATSVAPAEKIKATPARVTAQDVFHWKVVGSRESVSLLSPDEVNDIHWALVRDFGDSEDPVDPPGIRDVDLFRSAVNRPHTSFGGQPKYPTVSMAGSALFHAIVHNHPFHNGNKRTALVSLVVFLDRHGYVLMTDQDALYDYVLRVAAHEIVSPSSRDSYYTDREMLQISRWLQREMRRPDRQEFPLQFRRLKSILSKYDCEFEILQGNRLNIQRGDLHTQVTYGGDGREASAATVHKVRKDLELDEPHGYDSGVFYRNEECIPEFITKYRDLLARLAKV